MNKQRLGGFARRYWFDGLIVVGVGFGLAEVTINVHTKNGPSGPLWFDLLAMLAILLPLFVRRRFPFGAPIAVGVAITASSFVDGHLIPRGLITTLAGISAFVLMGVLRDRTQALAGLAFGVARWALSF